MKQKLTAFLLCFVMALSLCAVLPFGSLAEEGANAEGATKVVVTYATNSTTYEGEALGADFVWFSGLHATSLNNLITVESYVGDECVESYDTSVAMYISTALEAGSLTDDQANLARALAVYMRAARTYHEVLYPEVSE